MTESRKTGDNKSFDKTTRSRRTIIRPLEQRMEALRAQADPDALQLSIADPEAVTPGNILSLQRSYGNEAVTSVLQPRGRLGTQPLGKLRVSIPHSRDAISTLARRDSAASGERSGADRVQTKLAVGPVGDHYEQEADRVAERVMSMPQPVSVQPGVQRQEEEELQTKPLAASITPLVQCQEEEELLQGKAAIQRQEEEELQMMPVAVRQVVQRRAGDSFEASSDLEDRLTRQQGGGSPLPGQVRGFMEPRMGADFSDVRVHTGSEAAHFNRELQSQAFTHGRDIYFGGGKYDTGSDAGKRLLAHELTHVVQQTGSRPPQRQAEEQETPTVATGVDFGSRARRSLWGSARRVERPNPFTSSAVRDRPQSPAPGAAPDIQCYKIKVGNVRFESVAFQAGIANALKIVKDADDVVIGSQDYNPFGRVVATGPADEVGQWKLGFLQTVYKGDRHGYYNSRPPIRAGRPKVTVTIPGVPVRDGDAGETPWYGTETVKDFGAVSPSSRMSSMYDAPENGFAWIETVKGTDYYLVRTGGRDLFRSWLAVHNPTTDETKCLNYADWDVNYGTNVRVNAADEAASVVNPTTGGARLIGTGDGSGGKNPLLGDPVANEEAQVKDGVW